MKPREVKHIGNRASKRVRDRDRERRLEEREREKKHWWREETAWVD